MNEIADSVAEIRAAGLNVMVDLHTIPGGDARPASIERVLADNAAFDRYIDVAARFAARFAKTEGVALELINEPVIDCEPGQNRWPDMIARLHGAARKAAPDLPLVVTAACWGDAERWPACRKA
ncbi:MAG: cellulase family glycosylhydrolase [Phyllobacteriaceae bacterium]|nr:cellulase family glycosylhydrolase [Phyllobacteriaceae bacterium]